MKVTELLDSPEKWTKGAWARDKEGVNVYSGRDPAVTQWCIYGALDYCYRENVRLWSEAMDRLVAALFHLHNTKFIADWQDQPETTWEQVRTLLERADI